MFHRLPAYKAPSWLIALLLVVGVALDIQGSRNNSSRSDHVDSSGPAHKQRVENGFLESPERANLIVDR